MPIYNHQNYISLEPGATVWRYLDFDKFKSLLETKSLFFCRTDKFSDPFEGSIPRRESEFRLTTYKNHAEQFQYVFDEEKAMQNIKGIQGTHQNFKRGVVVNCWHINETESDAMWRLYLKNNEGVAIQSTKERIDTTIEKVVEQVSLSKVRYLDYDKDIWYHKVDYPHSSYNLIVPLIHKRIEFVHEQEFRMFIQIEDAIQNENYWDTEPIEKGKLLEIDLLSLIENVYLPPTIDKKATQKIMSLSESLGYNFNYLKSKLSSNPYY
jgi:hypothetical protein